MRTKQPEVKLEAVRITYIDKVLVVNGHQCSKIETLAVANLLLPDYWQIVREAREEQRKTEMENDKRGARDIITKATKAMTAQDVV